MNIKRNKSKITYISDRKIKALKFKKGWKGNGSMHEPIIIDDLEDLPPNLMIHRNSLHYNINSLFIYNLSCYYTQNITIENCIIYKLEIKGCYNITLLKNKIIKYKIMDSKGNNFIDNELSQVQNLKKNDDKLLINPLGKQMINPLTFFLFFMAISAFLSRTNFWVIGFIPIGLLTLLNYLSYTRSKRLRNKKPNFYANNIELQNKTAILNQVRRYYLDFNKT